MPGPFPAWQPVFHQRFLECDAGMIPPQASFDLNGAGGLRAFGVSRPPGSNSRIETAPPSRLLTSPARAVR